jgi:predicted PurR-regulated permease PerM
MTNQSAQDKDNRKEYIKKVWIAVGIVALATIILLLVKAIFNVFLLLLAGLLVAIFFRGLGDMICRKTKWKPGLCLTISIVGTFLLLIGTFWLIGHKVILQAQQLTEQVPVLVDNARTFLSKSEAGREVVKKVTDPETMQKAQQVAGSFFQSTFGVIGDIYVILLLAIFFVVSPRVYINGMVQLVPGSGRNKANEVISDLGDGLKKWLKGQIFAMFAIFILTAITLLILGMPLWLVLALIAGILNFIPNFGPLIAMIPAVLIGLMQSPTTAIIVAGSYILIQTLESSIITPSIQKKMINMPPALIIIAQLLVAPLTGFWGLLLATPLMLIVMILTNKLYIEKQ